MSRKSGLARVHQMCGWCVTGVEGCRQSVYESTQYLARRPQPLKAFNMSKLIQQENEEYC